VTYQGLLAERRRVLHGRIVEAIERLYPERLTEHTGNREQARERLSNATAMYREMDMPFWLEKAESALKSV
jgi:hypothetical protein